MTIDMKNIRKAKKLDILRLSDIEVFNYRLNFYPIFQNDQYYFDELNTEFLSSKYFDDTSLLENTCVYDDGVVKGFIRTDGKEVKKLFVEPVLHGNAIGSKLLKYAIQNADIYYLWSLEKNTRAVKFYENHGFYKTDNRLAEEGTNEFLVRLERCI